MKMTLIVHAINIYDALELWVKPFILIFRAILLGNLMGRSSSMATAIDLYHACNAIELYQ